MPEPQRPEEDVGPVEGEVEGHGHARVVDVGRQVEEVVGVRALVHVLLQQLVSRQVGRVLSQARTRQRKITNASVM